MDLFKSELGPMKPPTTTDDVIVIGAGLAGLMCALNLAPRPVTILTAAPLGQGASSGWALAGIASPISEKDSEEKHINDTVKVSSEISNEKIVRIMVHEAVDRVKELVDYGVAFDKDTEGRLKLSREASHTERRIAGVGGDRSGRAIMEAVVAQVRKTSSIRVLEGYVGERLLTDGGRAVGIRARFGNRVRVNFPAYAVVLATGGIGHLFSVTTNPAESNGQGLALAASAGAVMADLEFIQFHPTAIAVEKDPSPLASEALRGEGAILVNGKGNRIMDGVHPDSDMAPRDIVARAIHTEIATGNGAYLDCREAIGDSFRDRFPAVYESCRISGIDPAKELIPIAPAEHYHMGGILTDANGRTTVDRLWAAGEVASTGVHGANRLASNSLTEAAVFGARVARDIQSLMPNPKCLHWDWNPPQEEQMHSESNPQAVVEIRNLMSAHVGVVRDKEGLVSVLRNLVAIDEKIERNRSLKNMILAAKMITVFALAREESRGAHFRSDFPESDSAQARRSFLTLKQVEGIQAEYSTNDSMAD